MRFAPRSLTCLVLVFLIAACGAAEDVAGAAEVRADAADVRTGSADGDLTSMETGETRALESGQRLQLDETGEALLSYTDHLQVRLFRDTDLLMEAMADPDAPPWAEVRLSAGTVLAGLQLEELAEQRLAITTEGAVVTALATDYLVHVTAEDATTWTVVREGVVAVEGAGTTVEVAAGSATFVVAGQPPAEPFAATRAVIGSRLPDIAQLTNGALTDTDVLTARADGGGDDGAGDDGAGDDDGDGGSAGGEVVRATTDDATFTLDLSDELVDRADDLVAAVDAAARTFAAVRIDNRSDAPITIDTVEATAGGGAVSFRPAAADLRGLRSDVPLYDTQTYEEATALLDAAETGRTVRPGESAVLLFVTDRPLRTLAEAVLVGSMGRVELTAG